MKNAIPMLKRLGVEFALRRKTGYMSTYYFRAALRSRRRSRSFGESCDPLYVRVRGSRWVRLTIGRRPRAAGGLR